MKRLVVLILAVLSIAAGLAAFGYRLRQDRQGPDITAYPEVRYYQGIPETELLQGITAYDEVDGDVTDTLVIEKCIENDNGSCTVIYAARDRSSNVSKKTIIIQPDPEQWEFETEEITFTETERSDLPGEYSVSEIPSEGPEETEDVVLEETEEVGPEKSTEGITAEDQAFFAEHPGSPRIYLNKTGVTIHRGDPFDPLTYVQRITDDHDDIYALWRDIQVTGSYDTTAEGTYELTYYVMDSEGHYSNFAKMTLKVLPKN